MDKLLNFIFSYLRNLRHLRMNLFADHIATVALVVVAGWLGSVELLDSDVWWHLASGRWIVANRAVPRALARRLRRRGGALRREVVADRRIGRKKAAARLQAARSDPAAMVDRMRLPQLAVSAHRRVRREARQGGQLAAWIVAHRNLLRPPDYNSSSRSGPR